MSKDIIKLYNRYGDNIYLENLENNKWVLRGGDDYYRVIFDKSPDDIKAVDPSGGPFLSVGDKVEGKEIIEIVQISKIGFVFTLKDDGNKKV